MRILMLISELGYGGAEGSFLRLARQLAKSHQVKIAVFKEEYDSIHYSSSEAPDDLEVHRLDRLERHDRFSRWWRRSREFKRLRKEFCPHVTISFLSGPNLLNVITGGPGKRIVSVRGSRQYDAHAGRRANLAYKYLVDPIVWSRADIIVTVSQGLAGELARSAPSARAKIETISGYVDSDKLIASATEPVEPDFERLAGMPLIVAAGRLSPEKGFDHLLRIFAQVKNRLPAARLLLIGDGPSRRDLEREAEQLGLTHGSAPDSEQVDLILPGFRPDPHRYFRLGKAFVLCSASEGFPNVLIEALASGTNVVAGDVPWGGREILEIPADIDGRPYPTVQPAQTAIGFLMPRIDDPASQSHWVEVLCRLAVEKRPKRASVARALERVRSLDCRHAAERWSLLIERTSQESKKQAPLARC